MSNLIMVFNSMAGLGKHCVIAQAQNGTMYLGHIEQPDSLTPTIYFRPMDVDIEPLVEQGK